jgi:hypothetical protein
LDNISLCTVSFESAEWLTLNRKLVDQLNPGSSYTWLIAENSPPNSPLRLAMSDRRFRVREGAPPENRPYAAESYHHAAGLKLLLDNVQTRFLLVLDPDFFIIRPHWIRDVVQYMDAQGLAILGAPWHPSRPNKVRYFPCAHCTFIDLQRIPLSTLDFAPGFEGLPDWMSEKKRNRVPLSKVGARLTFARRRRIGTSRDTGWKMFDLYAAQPSIRTECFQPVYSPSRITEQIERVLPDRYSLIPKRAGYFSRVGFEQFGLPAVRHDGWEEFLWRDRPLGFHVRCFPLRDGSADALTPHIHRADTFLGRVSELSRELIAQVDNDPANAVFNQR